VKKWSPNLLAGCPHRRLDGARGHKGTQSFLWAYARNSRSENRLLGSVLEMVVSGIDVRRDMHDGVCFLTSEGKCGHIDFILSTYIAFCILLLLVANDLWSV